MPTIEDLERKVDKLEKEIAKERFAAAKKNITDHIGTSNLGRYTKFIDNYAVMIRNNLLYVKHKSGKKFYFDVVSVFIDENAMKEFGIFLIALEQIIIAGYDITIDPSDFYAQITVNKDSARHEFEIFPGTELVELYCLNPYYEDYSFDIKDPNFPIKIKDLIFERAEKIRILKIVENIGIDTDLHKLRKISEIISE